MSIGIRLLIGAFLLFSTQVEARQPERRAPNLASAVEGKLLPQILTRGPLAAPLCEAMGREACTRTKRMLREGWLSTPAQNVKGFMTAFSCIKYECEENRVVIAIDRDGRVWSAVTEQERKNYYGDPPANVREILDTL